MRNDRQKDGMVGMTRAIWGLIMIGFCVVCILYGFGLTAYCYGARREGLIMFHEKVNRTRDENEEFHPLEVRPDA
jgi:hypothetical protein